MIKREQNRPEEMQEIFVGLVVGLSRTLSYSIIESFSNQTYTSYSVLKVVSDLIEILDGHD